MGDDAVALITGHSKTTGNDVRQTSKRELGVCHGRNKFGQVRRMDGKGGQASPLTYGSAREGDKAVCEELSPVSEEDFHLLFEQL